jgi:hypothetical protein
MCPEVLVFALSSLVSPVLTVPSPFRSESPLKDEEIVAALVESLGDADGEVRQNIAVALANLGQRAVPRLIVALGDDTMERRAGAAQALGQMRPAPKSAVPALLKTMKDENELVRRHVSYALSRIVGRDNSPAPPAPLPLPPLDPVPSSTNPGAPQ